MEKRLSLEEALSKKVLFKGAFDNLIHDENGVRIWLSKLTIEDVMPYNNQIIVERYDNGVYIAEDICKPY